ncbi:MAG: OmpA family protein [Cyclobacteriaceae bacterium]
MKYLKISPIVLIVFVLVSCNAGKMAMKKGDKRLKYGEYEISVDYYARAIEKNHNVGEANFKIGEAYRLSNRVKHALPYYERAINSGYQHDELPIMYSRSLKANEKYSEARKVLEVYVDNGGEKEALELAQMEINNLVKLSEIIDKPNYFRVRNLEDINTAAAEYSPVYLNSELYFTSSRNGGKIYKATGTAFTDIYKAKTKGAIVDVSTVTPLGEEINTPITNEGSVTFSPDGQTMVFAKGNSGRRKGADDVNLFITRFRRGKWTEPEYMQINDAKSWDSSPAFSRDGSTLFFASNRSGGFGGTDLYAATRNRRGQFARVRNLGPIINTAGNEMFPHMSEDGRLHFSSNGHPGMGGLDIFVVNRQDGKLKVENLGPPVNSSDDDFAIYFYDPTKGFFSSNREGGKGDDDIYTFVNNDPDLKIINYFLVGTTNTITEESGEAILPNTVVRLKSANTDEILGETLTGQDGGFRFRVYEEEDYILLGEKDEYFTARSNFTTKGKSIPKENLTQLVTNQVFEAKLLLDQIVLDKSIVVENIYYDLDKWAIRPDAAKELDKIVTMLEDNPEIKIELSSHTDSRQTVDYNLELSRKRALSAVEYIVSKGIDSDRLTARGYGKSRLLISDDEINAIPNEEAREAAHQKNRRTEFKVTEIGVRSVSDDEDEGIEVIRDGGDLENRIDWDN